MKQWYTLRSKPRKEASVATLLSKVDIDVYLPQVTVRRQPGKPSALAPFFPGYLFSRLDPQRDEIRMARYTPGILNVVGFDGQPWPVPDDLIRTIQQRVNGFEGRTMSKDFRPGDRVIATSGPLRDVEAIFDRHLSAAGRARVLIQIFQRHCTANVYVGQLRRS